MIKDMENCNCGIMPMLRCDWEFDKYVFFFCNWSVELHIPFPSISKNMHEAFISTLISLHYHERFCSGSMPACNMLYFLELCECLVDVWEDLHVLVTIEIPPEQEILEEATEIRITDMPKKSPY